MLVVGGTWPGDLLTGFIKTALREWAYVRLSRNSEERTHALTAWRHRYNWRDDARAPRSGRGGTGGRRGHRAGGEGGTVLTRDLGGTPSTVEVGQAVAALV
jgi:hypothetical protein